MTEINTQVKCLPVVLCKTVFSQPAFTCSKLTIETVEQSLKYVQS